MLGLCTVYARFVLDVFMKPIYARFKTKICIIIVTSVCFFFSKPRHSLEACWIKEPVKKKTIILKGLRPSQATLPLNNITVSSLQAMLSQAGDDVLSSAKKH